MVWLRIDERKWTWGIKQKCSPLPAWLTADSNQPPEKNFWTSCNLAQPTQPLSICLPKKLAQTSLALSNSGLSARRAEPCVFSTSVVLSPFQIWLLINLFRPWVHDAFPLCLFPPWTSKGMEQQGWGTKRRVERRMANIHEQRTKVSQLKPKILAQERMPSLRHSRTLTWWCDACPDCWRHISPI